MHASHLETPAVWLLRDATLVLQEDDKDALRLTHLGDGQSITLNGVFAERMRSHLHGNAPFPNLGAVIRKHRWLGELTHARPAPPDADILMANGLGMLFIELTDRCNERCIHCYAESSPDCSARLTREEIRRLLEDARSLGDPAVQFTGGDPLLHPDIVFAVQTAHRLDYRIIEIYTNGLALNQPLLDALMPYTPHFSFSIYAADDAVHDRITRHPGSLQRTLKAIARVRNAGLPLRIGIVSMTENQDKEEATINFLRQKFGLDADQIGVDTVRASGRGATLAASPTTGFSAAHSVRRHWRRPAPGSHQPAETPEHSAPVRRGKLCVSAAGEVFPCIFSRRVSLGNIRRRALHDIVRNLQHARTEASVTRWRSCVRQLSCSDCQAIAYLLGDGGCDNTPSPGETDAPA